METKKYVVYVTETVTKKYFVDAISDEEAEKKYLSEGLTSPLYTTEKDREIIYVSIANEDNF
tara:strand:- start:829 stop:1014 length:186 start_codon:yes stop_codon:yes gene_type:complete